LIHLVLPAKKSCCRGIASARGDSIPGISGWEGGRNASTVYLMRKVAKFIIMGCQIARYH
jgi:hypothetical protein